MTKAQRRTLSRIVGEIGDLRAELDDLAAELETVFNGRSEQWQDSLKGQAASDEIDAVAAAAESILHATEDLEDLCK